ncbi:MAG: alanine--tRNA ligase [Candidatus Pacebacteria bacterium]|nr:alanine--tRNA ligase [Candidatus Paceibacterota bacterium]
MNSEEIREKFLEFFEKNGHKIIPSSSLIPTDPSVLLTTAGMQQFKPYYLGEKSPYGDKVCSVQKCFRTSDIDEVGDERHLTFFEMLGNFSFNNACSKKEAIELAYEFITKEMELEIDYVSVFGGEGNLTADKKSEEIWKQVDSSLEVKKFGKEDNFWGPTGDEGPCGPTTEIYVNGIEIWNIVFNEYYKNKDGKYERLETLGVDTGMGLERLAMVSQNKNNVFENDLFEPIMQAVSNNRIIADHLRGAVFLLADGITPSNLGRGYILRRLIRRVMAKGFGDKMENIADIVIENYGNFYPELEQNKNNVFEEFKKEKEAFEKTLEKGMKELQKMGQKISGEQAFLLFSTYGFPLELIKESVKEVDEASFQKEFEKHQELSRTASAGMFKSGLAGHSEQEIKYHTASHLLLAALRKVLGESVSQKGSNITPERLRLDFSWSEKLTDEQKTQVEKLVNEKIAENLSVLREEMTLDEAKNSGALGVFEHKYGEKVSVYSISDFSKEICGGPHVENTCVLGKFKIIKEEAVSAGVRRIKAILE